MGLSLLLVALTTLQTAPAGTVTVAPPVHVSEIDAGKLKGEPTELAWSPDGSQLFLQTSERDRAMMIVNPRYFVMPASSGQPKSVNQKPEWEGPYWTWKSGEHAPGSDSVSIAIKEEQKVANSTASPTGGALAKGGTVTGNGATMDDAVSAAQNMQQVHVMTLTLKGQQVGQFINQQFLPGYTFSWSPQSIGMIAYVNESGHLGLMDVNGGNKQQVDSTKDVLLPAWSDDGSKIAFLERAGRGKYDLYVVTVTAGR